MMNKVVKLLITKIMILTLFITCFKEINATIPEFRKIKDSELTYRDFEKLGTAKNYNDTTIPAFELDQENWINYQNQVNDVKWHDLINGNGTSYTVKNLNGARLIENNGRPGFSFEGGVNSSAELWELNESYQIDNRPVARKWKFTVIELNRNHHNLGRHPHLFWLDKSHIRFVVGKLNINVSYYFLDNLEKAPMRATVAIMGLSKEEEDTESLEYIKAKKVFLMNDGYEQRGRIGRGIFENTIAYRVASNISDRNIDTFALPIDDEITGQIILSSVNGYSSAHVQFIHFPIGNANYVPPNPIKYWATKENGFTTKKGSIENIVVSQRFLQKYHNANRKVKRFVIVDDISEDVEVLNSKVYKVKNDVVLDISDKFTIEKINNDNKTQIQAIAKEEFVNNENNYDGADIVLYHTVKVIKNVVEDKILDAKTAISLFDNFTSDNSENPTALIQPNFYTLTTSIDNGSIDGSENNILEGSDRSVNFILNEGYKIKKISINGNEVNKSNPVILNKINEDKNVVVESEKITFNITTTITNGTIDKSHIVNYGDDSTINYKIKDGYKISRITINDIEIPIKEKEEKITLLNIKEDKNIVIETVPKTFSITTSIDNGTITPNEDNIGYKEDRTVDFKISNGYELDSVTINNTPYISNINTINLNSIDEDKIIIVKTKKMKYKLTSEIDNGTIDEGGIFDHGTSTTINFKPPVSYRIDKVLINGKEYNHKNELNIEIENIKEDIHIKVTTLPPLTVSEVKPTLPKSGENNILINSLGTIFIALGILFIKKITDK